MAADGRKRLNYPLLRDETCFFLAVDFDKAGWQEDRPHFSKRVVG
jgi:hypothetical protein